MKPIWVARDKLRWLKRRANRAGLWLSYRLGLLRVVGLPYLLMIEPTNECNLRCPLCPTGAGTLKRPKGQMSFDLYQHILSDLDGALSRVMLYNYGEPFLHPRILDMIAWAHQAEIHTRVSTNGLVFLRAIDAGDLIASGLDYLRVSVDGATAETYNVYRVGGQLDRVLDGVRLLQRRKRELGRRKPVVELQFIVMRHNEHEIPAIRQIAHDLSTLLRLKSAGLGDLDHDPARGEWLPADESLRRYKECDGRFKLAHNGHARRACDHPWHRLVVNWDGQVTPCCYDRDGEFEFGNAAEGLGAVWNGSRLIAFRQAVKSLSRPAICQRCSVWLWGSSRMGRVERP
jgi:radical SAM protein with 4Fe4S-binding SPASM domain